MVKRLLVCKSDSFDPYHNLALEKYFLDNLPQNALIFYLWQNEKTVVLGRNQNAYKECTPELLEKDGIKIARRISGGGAVYHDLGNLNFTFLTHRDNYDVARQTDVILTAVRALGIPAEKSGRNDITTADGRKFSGNAYYLTSGACYHHGTLMLDVNAEHVAKYLTVSKQKLSAKGVDSVRSRIVNLSELRPGLDIADLSAALEHSLGMVYGLPPNPYTFSNFASDPNFAANLRLYSAREYTYGHNLPATHIFSERLSYGEVSLSVDTAGDKITGARLYSDSLMPDLIESLERSLSGCEFRSESMAQKLLTAAENFSDDEKSFAKEIAEYIIKTSPGK